MSNETIAWKICYTDNGQYRTALSEHNSVGDYRAIDPMASSIALCAAPVSAEPVAYLDIGEGGYMDLGTDLTEDQLAQLPKGRHMLSVVGTYGLHGYTAAPVAAQSDLTQQTLDDVKAGIPARDAEIEALRKEIETLQAAQAQPTGLVKQLCDALELAKTCHGAMLMSDPPQEMWKARGVDRVISEALNAAQAQQPVSGADQFRDAAQMIEPSGNSGELPELTIQWHDTPEAVHRIFWEKTAIENGLTYEELIEGAMVGETEERQKVDLTNEQEIQAIRDQKCWGCADTDTNQIHVWAASDVDRALLIHMLAHEIGHLTGEPHPDDIQEELRAETFGKVAAKAYQMLPSTQDADKVDAQRYRGWRNASVTLDQRVIAAAGEFARTHLKGAFPTIEQFDAGIDYALATIEAARKEQA